MNQETPFPSHQIHSQEKYQLTLTQLQIKVNQTKAVDVPPKVPRLEEIVMKVSSPDSIQAHRGSSLMRTRKGRIF